MRGSIVGQVQALYKLSGIAQIGRSKHEAKELARSSGAKTWHEIGKRLGIYSYSTADAYRDVWKQLLSYAKTKFNVKDIEKLNSEIIHGFLHSKIEQSVSKRTFQQYAAAIEKLEVALNMYSERFNRGNTYNFDLSSVRAYAKEVYAGEQTPSRTYEFPAELMGALKESVHQLIASIQYEGGVRLDEVRTIREWSFKGIRTDELTGQERGYIEVKGKGGKVREIGVSPDTYNTAKEWVRNFERIGFDERAYRKDLQEAANLTGQEYHGSHGLRWNFAQERSCCLT
jgi:site-specific recombinase XerC